MAPAGVVVFEMFLWDFGLGMDQPATADAGGLEEWIQWGGRSAFIFPRAQLSH